MLICAKLRKLEEMSEANLIACDDGIYKYGDARNMARNTFNAANSEMQIFKHSAFAVGMLSLLLQKYTRKRDLDVKRVRVIFVKYYESKV